MEVRTMLRELFIGMLCLPSDYISTRWLQNMTRVKGNKIQT